MPRRVSTYVYADDPILQAGVISQLRMRSEIEVAESGDLDGVDVGIAVPTRSTRAPCASCDLSRKPVSPTRSW